MPLTHGEVVEFHRSQVLASCREAHTMFAFLRNHGDTTENRKELEHCLISGLRHSLCAWLMLEATDDEVEAVVSFLPGNPQYPTQDYPST